MIKSKPAVSEKYCHVVEKPNFQEIHLHRLFDNLKVISLSGNSAQQICECLLVYVCEYMRVWLAMALMTTEVFSLPLKMR